MKSVTSTVYVLEADDLVHSTRFEDGSVGLSCPRYPTSKDSTRGFRIDFLPQHIPVLESVIALLKGAVLVGLLSLLLGSTPAQASPASTWCPTAIAQAKTMLERQADSDLSGKITVPGSVAQEDQKAYRKIIRRGRFLLKRYHSELTVETIVNVLKSDCEDVYNPTRNGTY